MIGTVADGVFIIRRRPRPRSVRAAAKVIDARRYRRGYALRGNNDRYRDEPIALILIWRE